MLGGQRPGETQEILVAGTEIKKECISIQLAQMVPGMVTGRGDLKGKTVDKTSTDRTAEKKGSLNVGDLVAI